MQNIKQLLLLLVVYQCDTIHYGLLLKIQPGINKMSTILHLILADFLRVRLSDFYIKFI
jgi:hypothetical protein